jgi:hypothetical protein
VDRSVSLLGPGSAAEDEAVLVVLARVSVVLEGAGAGWFVSGMRRVPCCWNGLGKRRRVWGLVEDTRENHPQAEAVSQIDGVRKGLPFWTAKARPYLIKNMLFFVGNWQSHLWTAW